MEQDNAFTDSHNYVIRVEGHLDTQWSAWFEEMTIRHVENDTILEGILVDQAALYGLLTKLRNLNLSLIGIYRGGEQSDEDIL